MTPIAACEDCALPYEQFPLDVVLSDADWLRVHPTGDGGLLCAACIVRRAAQLPRMIVVNARLVDADEHEAFRALKNVSLSALRTREAETWAQAAQECERQARAYTKAANGWEPASVMRQYLQQKAYASDALCNVLRARAAQPQEPTT